MEKQLSVRTLTKNTQGKVLTSLDRCDACGSQAYVWVNGVAGDLLFCSHHYTKIMNDPKGSEAMKKFAFETIDQRDRVSDKRAGL